MQSPREALWPVQRRNHDVSPGHNSKCRVAHQCGLDLIGIRLRFPKADVMRPCHASPRAWPVANGRACMWGPGGCTSGRGVGGGTPSATGRGDTSANGGASGTPTTGGCCGCSAGCCSGASSCPPEGGSWASAASTSIGTSGAGT
eukprot:1432257-Prymnesium_polylepis.1